MRMLMHNHKQPLKKLPLQLKIRLLSRQLMWIRFPLQHLLLPNLLLKHPQLSPLLFLHRNPYNLNLLLFLNSLCQLPKRRSFPFWTPSRGKKLPPRFPAAPHLLRLLMQTPAMSRRHPRPPLQPPPQPLPRAAWGTQMTPPLHRNHPRMHLHQRHLHHPLKQSCHPCHQKRHRWLNRKKHLFNQKRLYLPLGPHGERQSCPNHWKQ